MLDKKYNWSLISKWREFLMGLGITGVMVGHILKWNNTQGFLAYLFKPYVGLVFTEGFLLLSGFGLYYSFQKDSNIVSFYVKRIKRLLIPFILISLPFYLEKAISYGHTAGEFFLNITALHFWFYGNDGMWYISVSLLLYFLFPIMHAFVFKREKKVAIRSACLVSVFCVVCAVIYFLFPSYYKLTGIGLAQMFMFVVGIYMGFLSFNAKKYKNEFVSFLILGVLVMATTCRTELLVTLVTDYFVFYV